MQYPLPPNPPTPEQLRRIIARPNLLDELGILGQAAMVVALRELLDLRDTLCRAQDLATRERDLRMVAETERDGARAELALVRRAWVTTATVYPPPAPVFPYPDASG